MSSGRWQRQRRGGCFAVVVSGFVNLLLLAAIAMTGRVDAEHTPEPELLALEVFSIEAAAPRREARTVLETDLPSIEREPALAATAAFPEIEFEEAVLAPRLPTPSVAFQGALPAPGQVSLSLPGNNRTRAVPGLADGFVGAAPDSFYEAVEVDRVPNQRYAPLPAYPLWARRRGAEGWVQLRVQVSAAGSVVGASVMSTDGDPRFGAVAREAVENWSYEPALLAGRAVACIVSQRVFFDLED